MTTTGEQWKQIESDYYMQVVNRMPMVLDHAEGTCVYDTDGKRYLDFTAGWAVLNIGHSHPAVTKAIQEQAGKIMQMSNLFYTIPQLKLAQILIDNSVMDRVFFCNSGAEANEGVCKLARKYGKIKKNGANEIITANNSFHGRTMGMMAATGQAHYQDNWRPLAPGFVNVDYDDIDAIKAATNDKTCAVMLEPVQGEGGVNVPAPDYFKQVRAWCDENDLLLILDEVQTGMGRTGTLWAYEQEGIEPDIMSVAKALASGLPIGAMLAKEEVASHLVPGDHGTTFGANPVTCAAGVATLREILDNGVLAAGRRASERFVGRLRSMEDRFENVTEVRGRGMILAINLDAEVSADVVAQCREKGLLVNNVRPDAIRFMPPLTVSDDEIDRACDILEEVLSGL